MKGNQGASHLAQVVIDLIKKHAPAQAWNDWGTIQADGSLKLDRFTKPFPPGEYYTSRLLALASLQLVSGPASAGTAHTHTVELPAQFAALAPGDRVLVEWCNDGVDPVVIDVLERTG
jgi:hypothetical protein